MTLSTDIQSGISNLAAATQIFQQESSKHEATRQKVLADSAKKIAEIQAQTDGSIKNFKEIIPFFRLTANQALIPNADGKAPLHWVMGYVYEASLVERVVSGVPIAERSALSREFLAALGTDSQSFAGGFNIWRLKGRGTRTDVIIDSNYLMYQYLRFSSGFTVGCILKHEAGAIPRGWWATGLKAGEPAKWCGFSSGGSTFNTYTHPHPLLSTGEECSLLIALPAVVAGHVPAGKWGQFPYIAHSDVDGKRVFD